MKLIGLQILIFVCLIAPLWATNDSTKAELAYIQFEQAQSIGTQNPDSSIHLLQQSYENFMQLGDTSNAIQVLVEWAGITGHLADYKTSYDKLWKALILANEAGMRKEKASLYVHIGRYYSYYKRRDESLHYLELALKIQKQIVAEGVLPISSLVGKYYSICATYRELNQPTLAQNYLDSCYLYHSPDNPKIHVYALKFEQAFLLKEYTRYEEALTMFHEIKPWFESNRPSHQVLLLTYMGDTYKALKNYAESEFYYTSALAVSEQYNKHLDFTPLIYEKLADLYVSIEEFALAYQHLEKSKELDAMFFDSRSENNLPLLEIQDEFRKEQENREKLLQEQRIAQLEHEDQILFLQSTILAVSLILLITIGFIYFTHVRSRHQAERLEHEKVKEINQIKLRFFTNISHEFKTPLTLILGPLQQLLSLDSIDGQTRSALKMMERNANQLKRLINQVIEFRKLESTEVKLNAAYGDMVYFCRDLIHSFNLLAEEKRLLLTFDAEQERIEAYFDRDKLEKILNNLISNAIKYTPNGGQVRMSISQQTQNLSLHLSESLRSGYVELVVEDTGHGIPQHQLEKVFERYYQVDTDDHALQVGSGIGLALTKELVSLHQGEISVQSQEGKGSRFIIRLPLGNPDSAQEPLITDEPPIQKTRGGDQNPLPITNVSSGISPKRNAYDIDQHELPLLLIIEDNPDMLTFIRNIFEKEYRVLLATNGQIGVEIALSEVPDMIISDVMMPVMDGIDVCNRLKSHAVTSHIPIVLLTARSSIEHRIQGLATGADAYIPKPFHTQHLKVRVHKLLEQREVLRQKYEAGNIKIDLEKFGIKEADRRFLKRAEDVIEQNLSNPEFTAAQFHKDLGFSRMQLYRKLKSITGLSANEFIRAYKVKKAAVYLKESHLNITEVLYEVGFTNRSYFSKCFKQMYGMSPREYVNEHKAHQL